MKLKFKRGDKVQVYGHTSELRVLMGKVYSSYHRGAPGVVQFVHDDGEVAVQLLDGIEISVHEKQLVNISKRKSPKKGVRR